MPASFCSSATCLPLRTRRWTCFHSTKRQPSTAGWQWRVPLTTKPASLWAPAPAPSPAAPSRQAGGVGSRGCPSHPAQASGVRVNTEGQHTPGRRLPPLLARLPSRCRMEQAPAGCHGARGRSLAPLPCQAFCSCAPAGQEHWHAGLQPPQPLPPRPPGVPAGLPAHHTPAPGGQRPSSDGQPRLGALRVAAGCGGATGRAATRQGGRRCLCTCVRVLAPPCISPFLGERTAGLGVLMQQRMPASPSSVAICFPIRIIKSPPNFQHIQ